MSAFTYAKKLKLALVSLLISCSGSTSFEERQETASALTEVSSREAVEELAAQNKVDYVAAVEQTFIEVAPDETVQLERAGVSISIPQTSGLPTDREVLVSTGQVDSKPEVFDQLFTEGGVADSLSLTSGTKLSDLTFASGFSIAMFSTDGLVPLTGNVDYCKALTAAEGQQNVVFGIDLQANNLAVAANDLDISTGTGCFSSTLSNAVFLYFTKPKSAAASTAADSSNETETPPASQPKNVEIIVEADITPPSLGSVVINAGADATDQTTLNVAFSADASAYEMAVTLGDRCENPVWEDYATSKSMTISPTASLETITVSALFRDEALNVSECYKDTIAYDIQAPTEISASINAGALYSKNAVVTVSLAASGAHSVYLSLAGDLEDISGALWNDMAESLQFEIPSAQFNSEVTVYAYFADGLGNVSKTSDSIIHDNTAPDSVALSLINATVDPGNANQYYINDISTNILSLSGADASEYYISTASDCSLGNWKSIDSNEVPHALTEGSNVTLYAKYRDIAQNESECVGISPKAVMFDQTAPSVGSFAFTNITNSILGPRMTWDNDMSDAGSGLLRYEIKVGTSDGGTEVMDWTSTEVAASPYVAGSFIPAKGQSYFVKFRAVDKALNVSAEYSENSFAFDSGTQLTSINEANSDLFGRSLAISGDYLVISLHDAGTTNRGAIEFYKTTDNGQSWTRKMSTYPGKETGDAALIASDPAAAAHDGYMANVDIHGNFAVIAGTGKDYHISNSGAGYLYETTDAGESWTLVREIVPVDNTNNDFLGTSVAISDEYLVLGSNRAEPSGGTSNEGMAFVYNIQAMKNGDAINGTTEAYQKIRSPNPESNGFFGDSSDIYGHYLIVGAPGEAVSSNDDQGSAYIFKKNSGDENWVQQTHLTDTGGAASDQFGTSVSIYGEYAAVVSKTGLFVFKHDGAGSWNKTFEADISDIKSLNGNVSLVNALLTIHGEMIAVGRADYTVEGNVNAGAVSLFRKDTDAETWTEVQVVTPPSDLDNSPGFGHTVGLSDNNLIGGAWATHLDGTDEGAAYIFNLH